MVHLQKRLGVLLLAATWAIGTGAFEQTKVLAHVSVNLFEKNVNITFFSQVCANNCLIVSWICQYVDLDRHNIIQVNSNASFFQFENSSRIIFFLMMNVTFLAKHTASRAILWQMIKVYI